MMISIDQLSVLVMLALALTCLSPILLLALLARDKTNQSIW